MGNSSSSGVAEDHNVGAPMPTPTPRVGAPARVATRKRARGVGAPASTQIGRPIGTDPPASLPLAIVTQMKWFLRGPFLSIRPANAAESGLEETMNGLREIVTAIVDEAENEDQVGPRFKTGMAETSVSVYKSPATRSMEPDRISEALTDLAVVGLASYGYILKSQTPRVMVFVLDQVLALHNDVVDVALRGLNLDDWSDDDDEDELEAREEAIANAGDSMARLRREIEKRRTVLRPVPRPQPVRLDDESTNAMARALARALSRGTGMRDDSSDDSDSDW